MITAAVFAKLGQIHRTWSTHDIVSGLPKPKFLSRSRALDPVAVDVDDANFVEAESEQSTSADEEEDEVVRLLESKWIVDLASISLGNVRLRFMMFLDVAIQLVRAVR